jgi:hypothetical protein
MGFSKTFPKTAPGSNYPTWEEVFLTSDEEKQVEEKCRQINSLIMHECIQDAKSLAIKHAINDDRNVADLAVALFDKRASHVVFWKENKAKEKFDEMNRK